jgi:hypothetical protein
MLYELAEHRPKQAFNTSEEEALLKKRYLEDGSYRTFIIRLYIPETGIVNRTWSYAVSGWEKFDVTEPRQFKYDCPFDSLSSHLNDGVDENGEICWHCNGAGRI